MKSPYKIIGRMQSKANDDINFVIQYESDTHIGRIIRSYGHFQGLYFKLVG
jgi:hypothetical protein